MKEDLIKKLLSDIEECDSLHNNCDYLLEHSDCDLLIEYIKELQEEIKRCEKANVILDDISTELQQRIDKAIEYIKNNTMYFDSEYAKDYGELCPIAGAGDTRIHCVIGDKELLEILK